MGWATTLAKVLELLGPAIEIIQRIREKAKDVADFRRRMHEAVDRGDFDDLVTRARERDAKKDAFLTGGVPSKMDLPDTEPIPDD